MPDVLKGGTVDKVKPRVKLTGDSHPVTVLIEHAVDTPPTPTEPPESDDATLKRLALLTPMDYDRVRKDHATSLKIQLKTLDAMVKKARSNASEATRLPFNEVEPHPDPINPAHVLDEVATTIRQFIVLDTEQAHAAALWVALTWFIDVVGCAPLALINAPEKSCGKTQLVTVLGRLSYRPLPASNASLSALFRSVELWKPTLLIDEADTFFKENTELEGMVNGGYLPNGYILRSEAVGNNFEPRMFSVFSAKALAGITLEKHLTDATMSRGIVFNLRRKLPHESVSRWRHADQAVFSGIAEKLARFAKDYAHQVRVAQPALPDTLSDRAQDNWEPLLAIAECAGTEWVTRATVAALKLSGECGPTVSTGNELLADIQHVFQSKRVTKISTVDLIAALCEDEESAWATYHRGKPLSGRQITTQLSGYKIGSKSIRIGHEVSRGFELAQFHDAFARYLSENHVLSVTPLHPRHDVALGVVEGENGAYTPSPSVTGEPALLVGCNGVTDKMPI